MDGEAGFCIQRDTLEREMIFGGSAMKKHTTAVAPALRSLRVKRHS